ncbi:GNAT family N-acetyltransferase [Halopseudomonas salegens]|uniref:Predicted N-acyltransferase, GNAT family n=1 Tax=Halopseudomonas salegens TaxID=1434072 RepID=A0A1H2F5Z6_9GAMM|nr:GNAT family N-acetyltransferase [Halopseudomonas salegens]SDU02796.1 Predicted N-acyltransferase, GNAT family [Halopseudomonas salegens]
MTDIRINQVAWDGNEALKSIRHQVFVDEQQVPAELEWDADDAEATHFLLFVDDEPAGTARLLADGHIGRVAILPPWRGQGLGERLMLHIMAHAEAQGLSPLVLSAQVHALPFYAKLGFAISSEEYMEAGIPHREMRWPAAEKELPPIDFTSPGRFEVHNPPVATRARYTSELPQQLGTDSELVELDEDNAGDHLCHLILQTRHSLRVYHADLMLWLCHRQRVIDCLEQRIASEPRFALQVLLDQLPGNFLQGHSLAQLMHRFPSRVSIRQQHPELASDPQAYCLADSTGLMMLPQPQKKQGFIRYYSRDQVKRWQGRFQELWESGHTPSELRRFQL